ncbi:formimidoylglutamase [Zhouia amylolytica]|uniref:Arginase family hydrolase, arginase/agmainase/formiminoglutamate hydrolase n=1 Tax=Zhouia amylolytica AD3 TaxID=1286632 RepID=W2UKN9_9FLAO|nr:formimidoylglutamase [Zhouia amylolytica]ETN93882.1 arginase family hydrolase, arginase/agmainase/formiminoglutamate hydrolase [Zhouia amylolytica AD3]
MDLEFLSPVEQVVLAHNELLPVQSLGRNIRIHTEASGVPDLDGVQVAIVAVNEIRNASIKSREGLKVSDFRRSVYKLFLGNWNAAIADLGNIEPGETVDDTYFALAKLTEELAKKRINLIVLGGSQDLTYATYRGFDKLEQMVNLVSVDSRFDFGSADELISSQSYLSKIVVDQPNNLFNFSNVGYQTYYNAQEEIDLMGKLFFEAYRLGEIVHDITLVEPVMRDADVVSLDMTSVRSADLGSDARLHPNGFDGREICAIARYAGISDKVSVFGIYECVNNSQFEQLVAQIIWYYIEGYNCRKNDYPFSAINDNYERYIVPLEDADVNFYKSISSGRWWVEVSENEFLDNKFKRHTLIPCTHHDYLEACNNKLPERWWKAYKKMMV